MKDSNQIGAKITKVEQWAGPLPAPESLIKYNEALATVITAIATVAGVFGLGKLLRSKSIR